MSLGNTGTPVIYGHRTRVDQEGYIYRIVLLKSAFAKRTANDIDLFDKKLISSKDWPQLGIKMSRGWKHILTREEPGQYSLLFRRRATDDEIAGMQ